MKRLILLIPLLAAVAAAQGNCNSGSMPGTYAVAYIGWLSMGTSPTQFAGTIMGVISIGYDNKLSGTATMGAEAGAPVTDYNVAGFVTFKSACTGTMTLQVTPAVGGPTETEIDRFVFLPDDGTILTTIVSVSLGLNPAVISTWKRISPMPNAVSW